MLKCSICGKDYVEKEIKIKDKVLSVIEVPVCNCEEQQRQMLAKIREEAKIKEEIARKTQVLKAELNCPLMSPLFADKNFASYERNEPLHFAWNKEYDKNFNRCKQYAKEFEKGVKGLFMVGNVGTGKTSLQACIIKELEQRGKFCLLINFSTLLDLFIDSCSFDSKKNTFQLFQTLTKFDYICLDDIGREKYTEKRLEFAFRIIDSLMNNKVTLSVTTNPECFKKLIQIEEYKAIIDRLRFMCPEKMEFKNVSFRGNVT